jgi:hypothetical protein
MTMSKSYLQRAVALVAFSLLATLVVPIASASATGYQPSGERTYLVTIENLTDGQPFTPPVAATHKRRTNVWSSGEAASAGVQALAENGGVPDLVAELGANPKVGNVAVADGAVLPGESVTFEVTSARGNRRLSIASMLICTNDGFTGVDSIRLPGRGGVPTEIYANAYDAGTEMNTEVFGDLVPPCGPLTGAHDGTIGTGMSNTDLAEGDVIGIHTTVNGVGDLLPVHDWVDPVAKITVTRIDNAAIYDVKVVNYSSGQPLTPPVVTTHRNNFDLFKTGEAASTGIQGLAENGNVPGLIGEIAGNSGVATIDAASGPVVGGEHTRIKVYAPRNARRFSFASMLICTNDGFSALNSEKLPRSAGETIWYNANSYDAGTEINTEDFDDLVPPCGPLTGVHDGSVGTGMSNSTLAENGVISRHQFLEGNGDLSFEIHQWSDPVVKVAVTRLQ